MVLFLCFLVYVCRGSHDDMYDGKPQVPGNLHLDAHRIAQQILFNSCIDTEYIPIHP